MGFSKEEIAIEEAALAFAKFNKKPIAKRLTDKAIYPPEEEPVSVFMAGSPGAGKTEVSLELLEDLAQGENQVIRIDPDELRSEFAQYDGNNSYLFQKGVSVLVEKVYDLALKQKQSFLLDGTLSNLGKARANIRRSLNKTRAVQILYVYQDPFLAWEFMQARELAEGRRILLEHFVGQYFAARKNVNSLKCEFGNEVAVHLLLKDVNIGVSFPEYTLKPKCLGAVLRVHGSQAALTRLQETNWLKGMRDHTSVSDILAVPTDAEHKQVARRQYKTSAERLRRRRMKRKGETYEQAEQAIPDSVERESLFPFLALSSSSTGQTFFLFVYQGDPQAKPVTGEFNYYGLSQTATVPWF